MDPDRDPLDAAYPDSAGHGCRLPAAVAVAARQLSRVPVNW
jgi:hypothetical protein